jgi:hypothetical protein
MTTSNNTTKTDMTYTRENLENMTVPELRNLCVNVLNIPGMTKKRKEIIIEAILKEYGIVENEIKETHHIIESDNSIDLNEKTIPELLEMCNEFGLSGLTKKRKSVIISILEAFMDDDYNEDEEEEEEEFGELLGIEGSFESEINDYGNIESNIQISAGAAKGKFAVAGREIGEVREFLKEILNIDRNSTPLVNGKDENDDYIIKEGDTIEFLKVSGKKG